MLQSGRKEPRVFVAARDELRDAKVARLQAPAVTPRVFAFRTGMSRSFQPAGNTAVVSLTP